MSGEFTRESLSEDYRSELDCVLELKDEGKTELDATCWDFEKDKNYIAKNEKIASDKVIETLSFRLNRLISEEDFDWEIYNY